MISLHQQKIHELIETVKALKVFEQKEAVTQQTGALRQNIQELNTKLQSEQVG